MKQFSWQLFNKCNLRKIFNNSIIAGYSIKEILEMIKIASLLIKLDLSTCWPKSTSNNRMIGILDLENFIKNNPSENWFHNSWFSRIVGKFIKETQKSYPYKIFISSMIDILKLQIYISYRQKFWLMFFWWCNRYKI